VRKRLALTTLALVLVASLGAIGTAGAAPKADPTATLVGKVKNNKDGTATVKARYLCPRGEDWHLWVSAKQSADGSRAENLTNEAGFSGIAATWLQQHPTNFRCDGKWHTQKFLIDKTEPGPGGQPIGRGNLVSGDAWVQFCLISEEAGLFLIDEGWKKVR
jgi:hypothetical protein